MALIIKRWRPILPEVGSIFCISSGFVIIAQTTISEPHLGVYAHNAIPHIENIRTTKIGSTDCRNCL